jgi:hypothetical protein
MKIRMMSCRDLVGEADVEPGRLTVTSTMMTWMRTTITTTLARKMSKMTRRVTTTITRAAPDDIGAIAMTDSKEKLNKPKQTGMQLVVYFSEEIAMEMGMLFLQLMMTMWNHSKKATAGLGRS